MPPLITGVVAAQSGVTLMARINGNAGTPVTRATLSSIAYTVTDLVSAGQDAGTLTVSAVIFDSLQNDPRWVRDSADHAGPDGSCGYNFLAVLPATLFDTSSPTEIPAGYPQPTQKRYQVDVVFTPVSGQPWRVIFLVTVLPVFA